MTFAHANLPHLKQDVVANIIRRGAQKIGTEAKSVCLEIPPSLLTRAEGSKHGISTPDVAEVPERRSKFVGICLMKL
jgi:hypothetical protein